MVTYYSPESDKPERPKRSVSFFRQPSQQPEQPMPSQRQSSSLADCIACNNPRVCTSNNNGDSNKTNSNSTISDAFTMRNWSFDGSYAQDLTAFEDEEDQEQNNTTDVAFLSRDASVRMEEENDSSLVLQEENDKDLDNTMMSDTDAEGSIIVEHAIPDYRGNSRRKRRILLISVCCLMMGVVILTVLLALYMDDGSIRSTDVTVNDGSNVDTSVSDNIFNVDELPDVYYILEPKVSNASALLDPSTVEGKAFQSMIWQADQSSYNDAADDVAKSLDLIQRYALTTLYFGTDGQGWSIKDGWSEQSDVCLWWHGVECQNSVVTEIDLDSNNLKGSIPNDFCLLKFLESVSLSNNEKVIFPWCVSNMPFLEKLYLNGNGYEGGLPGNLHQMKALTHLELSDNAFTGPIRALFPSNINDAIGFPYLETLILSNNDLSGEIPQSSFRRMVNLNTLSISGNPKLTGSLNEICKGSLQFGEADCENVACRCCQSGPSCPSF